MAVDRPEDGGEFRHGQDRGADTALDSHTAPDSHTALGTDSAGLADPERRVIAHRMYRALVDRTYGVARDAWSQALPDLRATWAEHVAKYPEQSRAEPRTQPDGSWAADGGRKLGPDQNAEATRACADIRKEGKDVIRPAMERVEAADPSRRLTGLEHMLKGEDRLKEKIADVLFVEPHLTARQALGKVPDAVRGPEVTQAERDELENHQKRVNALIAIPLGSAEIEEFPKKNG